MSNNLLDRTAQNKLKCVLIPIVLVVHQTSEVSVNHDALSEVRPTFVPRQILPCVHGSEDAALVLRVDPHNISGLDRRSVRVLHVLSNVGVQPPPKAVSWNNWLCVIAFSMCCQRPETKEDADVGCCLDKRLNSVSNEVARKQAS